MNTQNDKQDKAAFFAAYPYSDYYREIKQYTGESNIVGPWKAIERFVSIDDMDSYNSKAFKNVVSVNDYLELLPLSSITDEHAIEVAKILRTDPEDYTAEYGHAYIKSLIKTQDGCTYMQIIDKLRELGYLLPFRNYTTQQLIDMGWVKLKTTVR